MSNEFEKPHRIDDLEEKLYSPNQTFDQKARRHLKQKEYDVPEQWESESKPIEEDSSLYNNAPKTNWFFRFFILAFIFFLGALGFAGYKFYFGSGVDAQNIDILINAPLTIGAGEVFAFETVIQNKNQMPIKSVDIEVSFPDGTRSSSDISLNYPMTKEILEKIEVGEIVKRNYDALLFGEEGEKKEITVLLTYQVDEAVGLIKKEKKFDVVLRSTPVRLTITNVKEITSGQELSFTVELVSNSTQVLKDVMVQAKYPFGFTFKNSSIAVEPDKRTWIIPSLAPKETLTFNVKGTIQGQNKEDRFFDFVVGLSDEKRESPQVVFSKKGSIISLARPFLELDLAVNSNNSNMIAVDPERNQSSVISFKNNTDSIIRNAIFSLQVAGKGIDESSVSVSEGFYQSLTDLVTWDYTTSQKLASIPIGSSNTLAFSFNGMEFDPNNPILNPELIFTLEVKGNRNPEDQVSELIENSIVKKIRFNTSVKITSSSEYYSSIFQNNGPIPPKVEQKTTYTALVKVSNTSNSVTGGVVQMKVPNYATYEGVYSPSNQNVSYDSVNRLITWNIGTVAPKTGYTGIPPQTLAVQVSIIPSISQAGRAPELITDISFTGTDTHTQTEIKSMSESITTVIEDAKEQYSGQVSK